MISPNVLRQRPAQRVPHMAVQILGIVAFTGFAIVATVMAFVMFWLAGVVLTLAFLWFGFRPMFARRHDGADSADIAPVMPMPTRRENTSFEAYRADMLRRMEEEQASFDGFLGRLREAKDAREFDAFMDDRARSTGDAAGADDAANPPKRGEY